MREKIIFILILSFSLLAGEIKGFSLKKLNYISLRRIKEQREIVQLKSKDYFLGERRGSAPGEFDLPHGIAVGPDGLVYVADSFNKRIQVFKKNPQTQKLEYYAEFGGELAYPLGLVISPDNQYAYVLSNKKLEKFLIKIENGNYIFIPLKIKKGAFKTSTINPYLLGIAISGDGKHLFVSSGSDDNCIYIFDTSEGREVGRIRSYFLSPHGIAISPDNSKILVADYGHNRILVFENHAPEYAFVKEYKLYHEAIENIRPVNMIFHPNGKDLIFTYHALGKDGIAKLDLEKGMFIPLFSIPVNLWGIGLSPDLGEVYASSPQTHLIRIFEPVYR